MFLQWHLATAPTAAMSTCEAYSCAVRVKKHDWRYPERQTSTFSYFERHHPMHEVRSKERSLLDHQSTVLHCQWLSQVLETRTYKEGETHYTFWPQILVLSRTLPLRAQESGWRQAPLLPSMSSQEGRNEGLEFPKGDEIHSQGV